MERLQASPRHAGGRHSVRGVRARLLIGLHDLLGVVSLGLCLVAAVTAGSPPPEAVDGPSFWVGDLVAVAYGVASVLFFLAARQLLRTGHCSPFRHAAPVICVVLASALFALIGRA